MCLLGELMVPVGQMLFIQFTEDGALRAPSPIGSVSVLRVCHFEPERSFSPCPEPRQRARFISLTPCRLPACSEKWLGAGSSQDGGGVGDAEPPLHFPMIPELFFSSLTWEPHSPIFW